MATKLELAQKGAKIEMGANAFFKKHPELAPLDANVDILSSQILAKDLGPLDSIDSWEKAFAIAGERLCERPQPRPEPPSEPEEWPHKVPIPVHIGIGVGRRRAKEIESILPSEVKKDRLQNENADNNAMADEFVGHNGLHKHSQQSKDQNLREGDDVELFEILQQVVVVVTGCSLHDDPA